MPSETQTAENTDNFDDLESAVEGFSKSQLTNTVDASLTDDEDKAAQVESFLSGDITNPSFVYPKQAIATDQAIEAYEKEGLDILDRTTIPDDLRPAYEATVSRRLSLDKLVQSMRRYNETKTPEAAAEYMRANIEAYGEPDESTYRSILQEKIAKLSQKPMGPQAEALYNELVAKLPDLTLNQNVERFKPSDETIQWVQALAGALYGNMLSHVQETETPLGPYALKDLFEEIIHSEFGEAASGWTVNVRNAKSIQVDAKHKEIVIPPNRKPMETAEIRRLVVHEIGIHMLRAVMGETTNLSLLQYGVSGYIDADEGLGKVMEQAVDGGFKEAGLEHYITAGLAYFDNCDFRDAFEVKWRMKLLEDLSPGLEPTEEQIQTAKTWAVDSTLRVFRGTNDLPLFKDLQYYNGSVEVWKYLESISGDDQQFNLFMAGRINTTKEHQRIVLESRTVE